MKKAFTLPIFLVFLALFFPASTFAQAEQEIPQSVIINGRQTHGVTVLQNGAIQSFNCPSPQPYTSSDGATSGWACLDTHTGTWLLNALPPQSIGTYPAEIPGYYYGYSNIAPYYYPYGYFSSPGFGFGFGFGLGHGHDHFEHGHDHFEHGGHGHWEHGGHGHGGGHR